MITEDTWPVVAVSLNGQPTLAETETFLEHFDEWLTRDERFGFLLLTTPVDDSQPDRGATKQQGEWVRKHKPQIEQACVGLAYVVDSDEQVKELKSKTEAVSNIYGCPADVFGEQDAAERWLDERLTDSDSTTRDRSERV